VKALEFFNGVQFSANHLSVTREDKFGSLCGIVDFLTAISGDVVDRELLEVSNNDPSPSRDDLESDAKNVTKLFESN
jgi:hypothetical protein